MNIEGRNYTGFQNVQVKGTGSAAGVVRFVSVGGEGQTMTVTQGEGEAKYLHLEGVGLSLGTGYIRIIEASGTSDGTLSIGNIEGQRAWKLPDKSGTLPISGTFSVQLPSAASPWFSTTVTVSGVRSEDALTVNLAETGTYTYGTQGTKYIHVLTKPGNGNVTLDFYNLGNATGYIILQASYTASRTS